MEKTIVVMEFVIIYLIFNIFIIDILITDGKDDSGDGVSHARVPDWAWSALGGQPGDEDYIINIFDIVIIKI